VRLRFLLLLLLLAAIAPKHTATAADRPHLLWITSEDHGPHLGCYGDAIARTPHLDALAKKGMIFQRAWSCGPVCAVARTALITGLYPSSSGALHMRSMVSLPAHMTLFPVLLRQAGYYCTNNTKDDYNVPKPENLWDEASPRAHWHHRPTEKPFFAVFNSTKSHESQLRVPYERLITDPDTIRVPAYHPDRPEIRKDWARYYDIVSQVDADAGLRLQEVEQAGLAADTIIFYYSDHGSGMPRSKRWPSNSGLQVPLIVFFPERWRHLAPREYQPGSKSERLVNFVDLAPTMLSLAGINPPTWMQGNAFAGVYQTDPPKLTFGERGRMDERLDSVRSVTDGRYVYVRNFFPHVSQGQHVNYQFQTPTTRLWRAMYDRGETNDAQSRFWRVPKDPEELYDLDSDPDEVKSLAFSPKHSGILAMLRTAQREHSSAIRDVGLLPEGEIHSRSTGSTPYDMAHDDGKYPYARIRRAAEVASSFDSSSTPELLNLLADPDSAVRYWAAFGFLMRGHEAVEAGGASLRRAMSDESPYVRVTIAQTLVQFGSDSEAAAGLKTLETLVEPKTHGVFVSMTALSAIDALGVKAIPLHEHVRSMDPQGPSPDGRYNDYVPRLVKSVIQP
jgi:arylsulfatase A-like enzyme